MEQVKATELYKLLNSKRIILVKSPLKMTNVLLKNVNFQYCVKLWGYLNSHFDEQTRAVKASKSFEEKGIAKDLIDEDFFLKYIIFNRIKLGTIEANKMKKTLLDTKEKKELTDKLIEKLVELNPDITDNELKKLIADKYVSYKTKRDISLRPLEIKFNNSIKEYLEKIEKLRIK